MTIYGTNFRDTLNGGNGNDIIYGYGDNDTIHGHGGSDFIDGGAGADRIDGGGGPGIDTASYWNSSAAVWVFLSSGEGYGYGGDAEGDRLTGIENLLGSWHNDYLFGNDGNNVLNGALGHDTLKGGGGSDTLYGDFGDDTLMGGDGADGLYGGDGVDTASYANALAGVRVSLNTRSGWGGEADGDILIDIENLVGSGQRDELEGDVRANVLVGYGGDDALSGLGGADQLYGSDGNDTLDGGADDDRMEGGVGDDTYYVDSALDIVTDLSGEGNDRVFSTAHIYGLSDSTSVEILSLDTATDTGFAGIGNSQHNTIFGNPNDNLLNGGGADDILNGLGGNDTFVFQAGQAHGDVVHEFQGNGAAVGDTLRFVGYGPGATFTQASASEWIIASADGSISEVITLVGAPTIDASDFQFL